MGLTSTTTSCMVEVHDMEEEAMAIVQVMVVRNTDGLVLKELEYLKANTEDGVLTVISKDRVNIWSPGQWGSVYAREMEI